jgi:hypothetical protein
MFLTGIVAIIMGILALKEIKNSKGRMKGDAFAVIGIIAGVLGCLWTIPVLIAMLLPAVQQVRSAARSVTSQNNMRQLSLAMHNHESAFMHFPIPMPNPADQPVSQLSWRVQILPFLERNDLYDRFHHNEPWDSPHNLELVAEMPEVFVAPSHNLPPGETLYVVPISLQQNMQGARPEATFVEHQKTSFGTVSDGSANTIFILEVDPAAAVIWTKPEDWVYDPNNPMRSLGNAQRGKFLAGFVDGSVTQIDNFIAPTTLNAMFTRNGGEPIQR